MLIQQAVSKAHQRMGLSSDQPPLPAKSLIQLWLSAVREARELPAFSCLGQTLSYGQVDQLSRRVAHYLQKNLKLQAGDRIAIQLPNLIQYPIVSLAAWRLGLIVVNTNPMYSVRELVHQFNDAKVKVVIVLDQFYDTLSEALPSTNIEHVVVTRAIDLFPPLKKQFASVLMKLTGRWKKIRSGEWIPFTDLLSGKINFKAHVSQPDDICALQYTGGTTGASKGVMLTQQTLLANIAQCLAVLSVEEESLEEAVMIAPLPLYHIYANALCLGIIPAIKGHSVLIPDPRDIPGFIKTLKNYNFDILCGLNSLFVALLEHPQFASLNFSRLRITMSGGMALMEAVGKQWQSVTGCVVSEGYGMTESSPVVSMNPLGFQKLGTAGIPVPGTEIKVIDEQGVEQQVGGIGELCVRGAQVMKGYWQNTQKTEETIVDGWLHTGDIVSVDKEGYIKIVDRLKDMIVVSGFNVYPNELEQALTAHPDISQCAAIGIADPKAGEVVKMFVVKADPALTEDQVIDFCKDTMAPYKVPKQVEFRDELPMSNVGKVLRKELKP
jgi:long-chain acyl-CoA synthetase